MPYGNVVQWAVQCQPEVTIYMCSGSALVNSVVQTCVHVVALPYKCTIIRAYIFTFATEQHIYCVYIILYIKSNIHILIPLNEVSQSSLLSMQSEQLWKMIDVPTFE